MLLNYHIGRLVLSSLCVGDLVRPSLHCYWSGQPRGKECRPPRPHPRPTYWVLPIQKMSGSRGSPCIFSCGAAAQSGQWPPESWCFQTTHYDASQPVGLLWTSDQLVLKTSTWQHTTLILYKHSIPGVKLITHFLLVLRLGMSGVICLYPTYTTSWCSQRELNRLFLVAVLSIFRHTVHIYLTIWRLTTYIWVVPHR